VHVDGFVVPLGERGAYDRLFSGKNHVSGQNTRKWSPTRTGGIGDRHQGTGLIKD